MMELNVFCQCRTASPFPYFCPLKNNLTLSDIGIFLSEIKVSTVFANVTNKLSRLELI